MAHEVVLFVLIDYSTGTNGLWISDGTASATYELSAVPFNFYVQAGPSGFSVLDGEVLFNAPSTQSGPPFSLGNDGLWETNGTPSGTQELTGIAGAFQGAYKEGGGIAPAYLTSYNGEVLFAGLSAPDGADNLWSTDGTVAGTVEITGIVGVNSGGVDPEGLTVFGSEVLFAGLDSNNNYGLWLTNGTADGTTEFAVIGAAPIVPDFTVFDGLALFQGPNGNRPESGLWGDEWDGRRAHCRSPVSAERTLRALLPAPWTLRFLATRSCSRA